MVGTVWEVLNTTFRDIKVTYATTGHYSHVSHKCGTTVSPIVCVSIWYFMFLAARGANKGTVAIILS